MVKLGNSSGQDIERFAAFGLTPVPAKQVKLSLIADSYANFECRVAETRLVNKCCLFVLEVLKPSTDPK